MDEKQPPGNEIKRRRLARDWSVRQLAEAAGVDKGVVVRLEGGAWGKPDKVQAIADALGCSVQALEYPDLVDEVVDYEGRARQVGEAPASVRGHTIKNFVVQGGVIIGPLGLAAESGPAKALLAAIDTDAAARDGGRTTFAPKLATLYRKVAVKVPAGREIVEARVPIHVLINGRVALHLPAGRLLIVDSKESPITQEVQLVIATHDPDMSALPTADNPHPSRGEARLMRYEPAPYGNSLLYPLDSDKAVTTHSGWRIAWVVIEDRSPPWPSEAHGND